MRRLRGGLHLVVLLSTALLSGSLLSSCGPEQADQVGQALTTESPEDATITETTLPTTEGILEGILEESISERSVQATCSPITCVSPHPECKTVACVNGICTGVSIADAGTVCSTSGSTNPCLGVCDGSGTCVPTLRTGASCTGSEDSNPCTDGVCSNQGACTPVNNGGNTCDDGQFCNGTDGCDASGGCTEHTGDPCAASAVDTTDNDCSEACNEGAKACTANDPTTHACNDGLFCTQTDNCDASGSCVGTTDPCAAAAVDTGDSDCSEACNEATNNCTANDPTTHACNDGLFCTQTDNCDASGSCVGTTDPCAAAAVDTGDSDCSEACNEATNDCTANDPTTHACTNTTDDAQNDGTFCNPADTCDTTGTCLTNILSSGATPTGCNSATDPNGCSGGDSCDGNGTCDQHHADAGTEGTCPTCQDCNGSGICAIVEHGTQDVGCSATTTDCSYYDICRGSDGACLPRPKATTITCADTNLCDGDEFCDGGLAGDPQGICPATGTDPVVCPAPADGCHDQGSCVEGTGLCTNPLSAGYCFIDGNCILNGTFSTDASTPCAVCNTVVSTTAWSPASSTRVCRAEATGTACDVPESCNGTDLSCPTDGFSSGSRQCRLPGEDSTCDPAENCTGLSATCPDNDMPGSETECGNGSTTECSDPDSCNGAGTCDPRHKDTTVLCTDANTRDCFEAKCDGAGGCDQDPAGSFEAPEYVCSVAGSDPSCNPEEVCGDRMDGSCPTDVNITACANGDGCCPSGCNDVPTDEDNDCPVACGNGIIEDPEEQCDDSNTVAEDGCSETCQWETPICKVATCAGADDQIEYSQQVAFGSPHHFRSFGSPEEQATFDEVFQRNTDRICSEISSGDFSLVIDRDPNSEPTCHVYQMNEDGTRGPEVMSGPATDADVDAFITTADPPLPPGTHLQIECTVIANGLTSAPCTRDIDVICTADSECADTDQCDGDETCDMASASPTFGQCLAGTPPVCDDVEICTDDSCDSTDPSANAETGCINANNTAPCAEDDHTCTTDVCSEGACTHPIAIESCLIDGTCYADGYTELDACRKCDATANDAAWTPLAPGTECRAAGADSTCDPEERCGTSGPCPANAYAGTTTDCGDPADTECSNPDKCNGAGSCSPMHESTTFSCDDTTKDDCLDSRCDGLGSCDQRATGEGSTYVCRVAGSDPVCNPAELCITSTDGTCPTDRNTISCDDEDDCCPSGCNTDSTNGDNDCPASCGNGIHEASATPPEACDDGNEDNADGCREDCTPSDCETGETQYCEIAGENGPCRNGMQTCDDETGSWGDCTATVTADDEICDGIDNDCNGSIDDGEIDVADDNECTTEACAIMTSIDMTEATLHLSFDNTIYDSTSYVGNTVSSEGNITYEPGRVGSGAAVFDDTGHISVSRATPMGSLMSVSLWVKIAPDRPTTFMRLFSLVGDTKREGMDNFPLTFLASYAYEGKVLFRQLRDDETGHDTRLEAPDSLITDGAWHHVAAINDGSIARLFIDGNEVATDPNPSRGLFDYTNPLISIGKEFADPVPTTGGSFVGSLDSLIILPPNISEDAIRVLANAGISHTNVADGTTCNDDDDQVCDQCIAGECDGESVDADEDGVNDCDDACPEHADSNDADGDHIPDGCDTEECDGLDNDGNDGVDEDFREALHDPCEYGTGVCKILIDRTCDTLTDCPATLPDGWTNNDAEHPDELFCNGIEICREGALVVRDGSVPDCADGNVCTTDSCDEEQDGCDHHRNTGCCLGDNDCPPPTATCQANKCDLATNLCGLVPVEGCCQKDSECDDQNGCTADACLENNTCTHVRVAPENIDYDAACEMVDCNEATGFEWKAIPNPAKKDELACNLCPEGKKPVEVFGVLTSTDKGEKVEFFAVDDPKTLVASFTGTDLGNFLNIGEFDQILVFTDGRHLFSLEYSLESRRLTMTLRHSFDAAVIDLERGDDKGDILFAITTDDRFFKIATKDYAVTELKGGLKLAHLAFNSFENELVALNNKEEILMATLPAEGADKVTEISLKPLAAKPTNLVKRPRWTQMKTAGDGRLFLTRSGFPSIQMLDTALAIDTKEAVYKTLVRLENDKSVINDFTTRKGFLFVAGGDNAIYKIAEADLLKEKDPDAKEEVLPKITPDKKIADGKTPLIFAVDACKDDPRCVATPEVCDGIDNDCDGSVDAEDPDVVKPELGFELVGVCADLQPVCLGKKGWDFPAPSQWAEILGDDVYTKEEDENWCDDEDNDCDGTTDEECLCDEGAELGCPGKWRNTELKAPCQLGTQKCVNGKWGVCEGFVLPEKEITDGIDNDCDGSIDEGCCQTCCVNVCCYCSVLSKWDHPPLPEFAPDYTAIDLPEEKPLVDLEPLLAEEVGEVAEAIPPLVQDPQVFVPEAECNEEGKKWAPADVWGAVKDGKGNISHVQLGECGPAGGLEAGGGGLCGISRNGGQPPRNLLFPILLLSLFAIVIRWMNFAVIARGKAPKQSR